MIRIVCKSARTAFNLSAGLSAGLVTHCQTYHTDIYQLEIISNQHNA